MPGYSDYTAENVLNWITGQVDMPSLPAVYLGLYTTAPTSDSGSGAVEVSSSGTSYARVQVAGTVTTNGSTASGNNTLNFASVPSWVVPGMTVRDLTGSFIPAGTTVSSITSTTVVMSANATGTIGTSFTIGFSAWPAASASSGTEPAVTPVTLTNGSIITFAPATGAGFGTVVAFGLFDDPTAGNLLAWDYLGGFAWKPATVSSASPGVLTVPAHGYSLADSVVVTAKYGGTMPTFSQANFTGILTVAATVATDTFTVTNAATAVNTSSTGDFAIRKIIQQVVPAGVTASFAASTLPFYAA
jgi:hypothetical protein